MTIYKFLCVAPFCSLIDVSVVGLFLAQTTFNALDLGIYALRTALGRLRVQDGIISGLKNDHTGEV